MKQTITLAAGLGSRLGSLTESTPKALISVAEKALIEHTLGFLHAVGSDKRYVVGGYCYEDLAKQVAGYDKDAIVVENPDFRKGNLLTLCAGLKKADDSLGFLVTNADHIYPTAVASIVKDVMDNADEITIFCDFDRQLTDDDMKVKLTDDKRVENMSKKLTEWDAGYVGMTYIPNNRRKDYAAAISQTHEQNGLSANVEAVVVTLAQNGIRAQLADISGHGWYEIDEPHERDKAEASIKQKPLS